jgi:nucleotide-binding universal stress UspA family protein
MGRKGEASDLAHFFLGSTADRVLQQSPCPVLVVPQKALQSIQKIVVPIDFFEACEDGLREAIVLAKGFQAKIIALHVGDQPIKILGSYILTPEEDIRKENDPISMLEKYHQEKLDEFIKPYLKAELCQGVDIHSQVLIGDEAVTINSVAEEGGRGLIVMGSAARKGIEKFLLGSITKKVLKMASCPVLVLKV